MMQLTAITEENFTDVLNLKLLPEQESFVSSNVKSLAQCWLYRNEGDVFPYALTSQGKVVGFVLLETDLKEKTLLIWRLMIGDIYQAQGYGRQALAAIIAEAKKQTHFDKVIADYVIGNNAMKHLLTSFGFQEAGAHPEDHEIIMTYQL